MASLVFVICTLLSMSFLVGCGSEMDSVEDGGDLPDADRSTDGDSDSDVDGDGDGDSDSDSDVDGDGDSYIDSDSDVDGDSDGDGDIIVENANSVTKDDITWTFDSEYEVGQFITGDWFVVAPSGVQVTNISTSGSEPLGGSMKNPAPNNEQGYWPSTGDSVADDYLTYNPDLNVGLSLPISLSAGDKIVSTTLYQYYHQDSPDGINNTRIEQAAILTVLASVPPVGSFRPGLCDLDNIIYNEADIDYSLLQTLTPTSGAPSLNNVADSVARPWLDHFRGWPGRAIHPNYNMRDYGAELTVDISKAALMVNSDYSNEEKRPIVIGLIQMGLDFYSNTKRALKFYQHQPGHINGRKFPIMFAGNMLSIEEIVDIWPYTGSYLHQEWGSYPNDARVFAEDSMHAYVTQEDVDETASGAAQYTPDHDYTTAMIGMPEWFHHDYNYRWRGSSSWSTDPYRRAGSSDALEGVTIAVYAMGWEDQWNHQAFFDYMDRYVAISNGDPDPFGYEVHGEPTGSRGIYGSHWCVQMWNEYRNDY